MKKEAFFHSKTFKAMLPLLIVAGVIVLFQRGYDFGKWLFSVLQ